MSRVARVHADGACWPNPGPAAFGAVVYDIDRNVVAAEVSDCCEGQATSNTAEYEGLIAGLDAAWDRGFRTVEVFMDSQLVVNQVNGRWRVKTPHLAPLRKRAMKSIQRFDKWSLKWIPREQNTHADALAGQALRPF